MSDLTARPQVLVEAMRQRAKWSLANGAGQLAFEYDLVADRIEALEAENAALEFDVAALDELNIALEAECDRLEAENARLRADLENETNGRWSETAVEAVHWRAHQLGLELRQEFFVLPGQAVRPDGVVCDLVEATDETAAFTRSYVIDRITRNRAWILRPVALPESGAR